MIRGCAVLLIAACAGPSKPIAKDPGPPPPWPPDPGIDLFAGEMCQVLEQVRAAAPTDFVSLRGTKKSDTLFESTISPAGATTAVVSKLGGWSWQATVPTLDGLPAAPELRDFSISLSVCWIEIPGQYGKPAWGTVKLSEPHASEPNGPLDALEFQDVAAKLTFSLLAEGKQFTLTVSRAP